MAEQYLTLLDSCDVGEKDCNTSKLSRTEIETKIENINKRLANLKY